MLSKVVVLDYNRDGPIKGQGGPFPPPPPKKTISLKKFSILEDLYFRVYSWPPSNFWIGSNNLKETNHLTLFFGPMAPP